MVNSVSLLIGAKYSVSVTMFVYDNAKGLKVMLKYLLCLCVSRDNPV